MSLRPRTLLWICLSLSLVVTSVGTAAAAELPPPSSVTLLCVTIDVSPGAPDVHYEECEPQAPSP